jgi:hypothetical protein
VVRIAICSCVRLGEAWNFVQFIVLMERIRFHYAEVRAQGEFLEIDLESDGADVSNLVFSHAVDGDSKPSTVRKRISRSEKNVRVLEYFRAISNLIGKIFAM